MSQCRTQDAVLQLLHPPGFSLLSSFHGDNSKEWAVCLTLNAGEDGIFVRVCMPHDILCHYVNIPLSFYSDIKSVGILTRNHIETSTHTQMHTHNFPALDLISLLMIGWRTNVSTTKKLIAQNIQRNELQGGKKEEKKIRLCLPLFCLSVSIKRGLEDSHLFKCYSLKPPLNLNRLAQYWCSWKCEATRDELQPAVGLPWYFHRGTICTSRIGLILTAKARQRFICGDEMWILQRDNIELKWDGVRPVLRYNSRCMEPYIILSFFPLPNKRDWCWWNCVAPL